MRCDIEDARPAVGPPPHLALRHTDAGDPYAAIYADMRALWIRLAQTHGLAEPQAPLVLPDAERLAREAMSGKPERKKVAKA